MSLLSTRWAPRTLFGRNLLLLLALFLACLVCGTLALRQLVQKPRITQFSNLVARQVRWAQATLEALPPAWRSSNRPWLNAQAGGALLIPAAAARPPPAFTPANPTTRQFRQDLLWRLPHGATEVRWSPQHHGTVWVRLTAGEEEYWFVEPDLQVGGELPVAGITVLVVTALLAVAGAALLQHRINRPLTRLAHAANELAEGEHPARLSEEGPTEIATVAKAFNQMNAALAQLEADRTVVLAGVSHDLRTPLTKIRLAVEMLKKDGDETLIGPMLRSAAQMDAIIDQFLDYARAGSGEEMGCTDLNDIIRECVDRYAGYGRVIPINLQSLPKLLLRQAALRRGLDNLIENALRYGGAEVLIESKLVAHIVRISVLDRGPGIALQDIEALKKPFVRGSNSAAIPGSGLGLAIVDRMVRGHGGRLALLPRPGGGLEARMEFPVHET
jgi:two-component system osmolarity sensor histidine kinase EnvZ